MTGPDAITVLRARGRRLAKIVAPDGTIQDYDKPYRFDLSEVPVTSLDELERLLRRLECRRDYAAVRGAIADPTRAKGVRRLLYRDGNDDPTLVDTPKKWAALDFDGLPRPDWIDLADLPGCACVAIRKLPNPFQKTRCLVQATASHGLKPGIRIRLWYWLDRPTCGSELKYWLRSAPLDPSIFSAAQITYTAAPLFLAGAFDPLPSRLDTVPGAAEAIVPSPERLRPPPRKLYSTRAAGHQDGISGLVRAVATAPAGKRNALLYWAACRVSENPDVDQERAGALLEDGAIRAGLTEPEAAATVRSGVRHGGR
jgi:hypothetical protein